MTHESTGPVFERVVFAASASTAAIPTASADARQAESKKFNRMHCRVLTIASYSYLNSSAPSIEQPGPASNVPFDSSGCRMIFKDTPGETWRFSPEPKTHKDPYP